MKDKFGRVKNDFGEWLFEPTYVSHAPRNVGRGRSGDPIYPVLHEDGVQACCKYYDEALEFLSTATSSPPSLEPVVLAAVPHGAIFKVALANSNMQPDIFGPKALISIEDADRFEEAYDRTPRWFDPEYVPALLMLTSPGGSLRFNDSMPKEDKNGVPTAAGDRRFFVTFGRGQEQNHRLLRVITDAPQGSQVHRITAEFDGNYHYDYRKNCLNFVRDDTATKFGMPAGYSGKGRGAAIGTAGDHFERATKKHGKNALRHVASSRASFEKLLRHYFEVADRLHAEQTRRRKIAG